MPADIAYFRWHSTPLTYTGRFAAPGNPCSTGLGAWAPWFDSHRCQLLVVSLRVNPIHHRSAVPTVVNTSTSRGLPTNSVTLKVLQHLGRLLKCRFHGFTSHPLGTSQECAFLTSPPNDLSSALSACTPYLRPMWGPGAAVEEPFWALLITDL